MIKFCTCSHAYQDRVYGSQKRVHNPTGAANKPATGYRCTVCGKESLKTEKTK